MVFISKKAISITDEFFKGLKEDDPEKTKKGFHYFVTNVPRNSNPDQWLDLTWEEFRELNEAVSSDDLDTARDMLGVGKHVPEKPMPSVVPAGPTRPVDEDTGVPDLFKDDPESEKRLEEMNDPNFIAQKGPYKIIWYTRKSDGVRGRYVVVPGDIVWPPDLYPRKRKSKPRRGFYARIPDSISDSTIDDWGALDVSDFVEPAIEDRRDKTKEYYRWKTEERKRKQRKLDELLKRTNRMLNKLIKIANTLDQKGLYSDANTLDRILRLAVDEEQMRADLERLREENRRLLDNPDEIRADEEELRYAEEEYETMSDNPWKDKLDYLRDKYNEAGSHMTSSWAEDKMEELKDDEMTNYFFDRLKEALGKNFEILNEYTDLEEYARDMAFSMLWDRQYEEDPNSEQKLINKTLGHIYEGQRENLGIHRREEKEYEQQRDMIRHMQMPGESEQVEVLTDPSKLDEMGEI
jgi:hypothetical protein